MDFFWNLMDDTCTSRLVINHLTSHCIFSINLALMWIYLLTQCLLCMDIITWYWPPLWVCVAVRPLKCAFILPCLGVCLLLPCTLQSKIWVHFTAFSLYCRELSTLGVVLIVVVLSILYLHLSHYYVAVVIVVLRQCGKGKDKLPSGGSLSQFPYHEVTESISTPPWMGC